MIDNKAKRYLVAGAGPVAVAGTHFLVSLIMLRAMSALDFGTFAFMLIAVQMSWGIFSALFCAPFQVFQNGSTEDSKREAAIVLGVLLGASLASLCFMGIAAALQLSASSCVFYAAFGGFSLVRWFARAWCYSHSRQWRVVWSDGTYSLVVLGTLGLTWRILDWEISPACYAALFSGALFGLLPMGAAFLGYLVKRIRIASLGDYAMVWRRHARWGLAGVLTTEATANAHSYIVILAHGASAFAPIAAAAILLRPINVAQNALTDFERPQMARLISARNEIELARTVRTFRLALLAIWIMSVALGALLFLINPQILFPASYNNDVLLIGSALWAGVSFLILLQKPNAALLEAAGEFRPLAAATVWGAAASLAGVFVMLQLGEAIWTIAGVGLGWAVASFKVRGAARIWNSQRT